MPVQGNVGRVEVEDDLPGWPLAVRLEEEIDEQRLDRRRIMADAVIAARLAGRGVFQPVQGALAKGAQSVRRAASLPARIASTGSWRSWS